MSSSRRVVTNLLQQNCYVRDKVLGTDLKNDYCVKTYISIDESVDQSGLKIVYNEYPYPITPGYVNSFVDSTDYRKDPLNAIANGACRSNLGDVTKIQDILKLDSSVQRSVYEQLRAKFSLSGSEPIKNVVSGSEPIKNVGGTN